ncbi:uncharacterized protein LOC121022801 [Herpailurus yagouaroundi]|uniref:uncharacterized protein LOC121022801 n=1 Tax=Herpailurus yagouaroundi TaxID=1608482 RepID=UPI001AD76296|nr:uncharacterized protein LOC121022801 [Puma yagouaroundi]
MAATPSSPGNRVPQREEEASAGGGGSQARKDMSRGLWSLPTGYLPPRLSNGTESRISGHPALPGQPCGGLAWGAPVCDTSLSPGLPQRRQLEREAKGWHDHTEGCSPRPGERWVSNCQDCVCHEGSLSVRCTPVLCEARDRPPQCSRAGLVTVTRPVADKPCCLETLCVCNTTTCPQSPPRCVPGEELVATQEEGDCCPTFSCRELCWGFSGVGLGRRRVSAFPPSTWAGAQPSLSFQDLSCAPTMAPPMGSVQPSQRSLPATHAPACPRTPSTQRCSVRRTTAAPPAPRYTLLGRRR